MKVFETGQLPVHVTLTELYRDETPEGIVLEDIALEDMVLEDMDLYWKLYHAEEHRKIQEEIDLSWELYYAEEQRRSAEQKADEAAELAAELAWYDHKCMQNSSAADSDDDYATTKLRESYDRANRYNKTSRNKNRFRVAVITAFTNSKRFEDDGHGKVIRNRRIICNPKDPYRKLWEQVKPAERMKLVPVGEFRRKKKKKKKNKNKKRRT